MSIYPILQLEESGAVLSVLLRMSYTGTRAGDERIPDSDYEAILRAAEKYEMQGARRQIRQQWREYARTSPLRAYFSAVRWGWKDEMKQAAAHTLPRSLNALYIPQLETATALSYLSLIRYHESSLNAVHDTFIPIDCPDEQFLRSITSLCAVMVSHDHSEDMIAGLQAYTDMLMNQDLDLGAIVSCMQAVSGILPVSVSLSSCILFYISR